MPKYTPIDPNDSALLEHVFKEAEKQTGRPLTFHERAAIMRHAVIETPSEKWILARDEMRISPKDWFRHQPLDARDRALINACNRFLNNHWLWYQTFWTVENDQECRSMIRQAGSDFIGFENGPPTTPKQNWHSMKPDIAVEGDMGEGLSWGLLCGQPSKTRVFAGPKSFCYAHP